ncbi:hypothetical protein B0T11DRAFT_290636 [Plectosphaerella cucumerina]|uniref:Uncharacterized protein n=1 Tax=Plectosphaerella cucumerina TaxID=40658 RepID=A0A8K0T757_9PEZI|nr:hypothetical protein B0T11DRAFT_290636 [Plectosphaerella cucumerina]
MPEDGTSPDSAYTRLHIVPFDADLAKVVIPASALPSARNISFHTVETYPEKRYGFVDLPTADADKIRKKLNGNVLKGLKMRIDKAKPEAWKEPSPEREVVPDKKRKKNQDEGGKEKKRKKDHNVIPGIELEEGRKVKRGWTVTDEDKIKEKRKSKKDRDLEKQDKGKDKDKKKKKREERSKYTEKEECLLKTKLPGVPEPAPAPAADSEETDRKRRKKSKSRETVIHEFANTTKYPTFLKANKPSADAPVATEFVDGKGWVDAEGNVIEDVKLTRPEATRRKKSPKKAPPPPPPEEDDATSSSSSEDEEPQPKVTKKTTPPVKPAPVDDDTTSSSGSSSEDESDSDNEVKEPPKTTLATPAKSILKTRAPPPADDTSSSESSSEDSDDEKNQATKAADASPTDAPKSDSRPKSSSSNVSLTIKIPPPPTTPGKVHPLEALYKKNKEAAVEGAEEQPFSFFAGGGDDIEEDGDAEAGAAQMPLTPFTERDFEWRQLRSAAPTPDTAHPSRIKNFWAIGAEGEDEEMADDDEVDTAEAEAAAAAAAAGEDGPSGDFQKWFWENRRDLTKSWMSRKKTAAKEKRHRDNKSRAAKGV